MQPVAITGIGLLSVLGRGPSAHAALETAQSAFRKCTLFEAPGIPESPVAQVDGAAFEQRPQDSRTDALALAAASDAWAEAALPPSVASSAGVLTLGTTTGGIDRSESEYLRSQGQLTGTGAAAALRRHAAGAVNDRLAQTLRLQGPRHTFSTACSSSANAIGYAALCVSQGVPWALAGGVDALCQLTYLGFHALRLLSPHPCQPFDRQRLGLSLGEAAAFLVLEPESAARARGARIWGRVLGWGCTADAHHMTAPEPTGKGAAHALNGALQDAGLAATRVQYVNAHGTGTAANDRAEGLALASVFGEHLPPTSSTKALTGHTLGAAGALEAALTCLALNRGRLPATVRLRAPDPDIRIPHVPASGLLGNFEHAVSLSLGFGGNNAALVLGRGDP